MLRGFTHLPTGIFNDFGYKKNTLLACVFGKQKEGGFQKAKRAAAPFGVTRFYRITGELMNDILIQVSTKHVKKHAKKGAEKPRF